jgi:hypothetical protein
VSLTAAVVADKLYSDEEWRWFRSRRSTGRSAWPTTCVTQPFDPATLCSTFGGEAASTPSWPRTAPARPMGLDFLPEMLTRTADAWAGVGLSNVEPLESELEAIPLPGNSDLIISNGVINLSASKARCGNHGSPA